MHDFLSLHDKGFRLMTVSRLVADVDKENLASLQQVQGKEHEEKTENETN
jgi:hypothetical protein